MIMRETVWLFLCLQRCTGFLEIQDIIDFFSQHILRKILLVGFLILKFCFQNFCKKQDTDQRLLGNGLLSSKLILDNAI